MTTPITSTSDLIRCWFWMHSLRYCKHRYVKGAIKLNSNSFTYADWPSFVHQYHDIFIRSVYALPRPESIESVLDCGVNVGTSMVYFLSRFPNARVWGWEADASLYAIAESNLVPYPSSNWFLENKAVWKSDEGVNFFLDGADAGSLFPISGEHVRIASMRLLDKISEFDQIDLLKLDIEGAEYSVLQDIQSELHKIQYLFVEVHLNEHFSEQFPLLINLIVEAGFRFRIEGVKAPTKAPFLNPPKSEVYTSQLNIFCSRKC
jgi:FkbM family methyltransferase